MKSFIFIGGDTRSLYAAQRLNRRYDCCVYGFDLAERPAGLKILTEPEKCSFAVLPLPVSRDGTTINCPCRSKELSPVDFEILRRTVQKGGTVFTSKVFPALEGICSEEGFSLINYFEREELAVLNAIPTAEGAIEIAIRELPITLFGAEVIITGYGRIAKTLAKSLNALGARVTVACRKYSDMAWAEIDGCKTVSFTETGAFEQRLPEADLILNTVPAKIFDRRRLTLIRKGTLFIELASVSSIEDPDLAESIGTRVITARSLPGRTAPVSAGAIIADTLENILAERSIRDGT